MSNDEREVTHRITVSSSKDKVLIEVRDDSGEGVSSEVESSTIHGFNINFEQDDGKIRISQVQFWR